MPRCSATKPDGSPCERIVEASKTFCYSHDPARAEVRKRAAGKAGRSKPTRELSEVKKRLKGLAEDVIAGDIDRGDAAVAGQLLGTYIRAVSVDLKAKEVEEFAERLDALEQVAQRRSSWG
jgi:hypothetical protein